MGRRIVKDLRKEKRDVPSLPIWITNGKDPKCQSDGVYESKRNRVAGMWGSMSISHLDGEGNHQNHPSEVGYESPTNQGSKDGVSAISHWAYGKVGGDIMYPGGISLHKYLD